MERLNPKTNEPWKYGEVREDGKIFLAYRRKSRINKDGTFQINWLTPEAWERRNIACKESAKRAQKRNAKIIQEEKLKKGCECCGYNAHGCALDFDHLDPLTKKRDISKMHTTNVAALVSEIEKCQVLCANCHRIKTHDLKAFNKMIEQRLKQFGCATD